MIHSFDDWREELRDVDAELISLLQRRLKLAIEFLHLLRTDELSLGDMDQDMLRLGILNYNNEKTEYQFLYWVNEVCNKGRFDFHLRVQAPLSGRHREWVVSY